MVRREEAAEQVRRLGGDIVLVDGDDLGERITKALDGQQLRLVVDGGADATTTALASALEFRGAVVNYSSVSGTTPTFQRGDLIFREISLHGLWMVNWVRNASPEKRQRVYTELTDLLAKGVINAAVEATYPLTNFKAALAHAQRPERSGKILFTPMSI